jgi:hypothetical protein
LENNNIRCPPPSQQNISGSSPSFAVEDTFLFRGSGLDSSQESKKAAAPILKVFRYEFHLDGFRDEGVTIFI